MQRRNKFTIAMLREPIKEAVLLKNYIDWGYESRGAIHDIVNPETQKVIVKAPSSTRDEVSADVKNAKGAFPE